MKTIEFLSKVLAPEDNYVLFIARNGGAQWNENYNNLEACVTAVESHNKNNDETVYMAVGAFADNVHPHPRTGNDYVQRKKHQATKFKTLAIDLDVGEGDDKYDSQKDAVQSLGRGCNGLGFPTPMVMDSGKGVHAYWPFLESVKANVWENMSLALRAALESKGVKLDVSKISDRSMVLRPAGAHHKKDPNNWKEVRLAADTEARSVREYAKLLAPFVDKSARPSGSSGSQKRTSSVMDALAAGDANIKLEDMKRCPQLAALLASAGATDAAGQPVPEPLWRASLGLAKFCEDREQAAMAFSSGHPDYDQADCIEKMEGWSGTGPANCGTFENYCDSGCTDCPHKGNITSPAQLSGGITEIPVENPETGEEDKLILPQGYSFKNRTIYYRRPDEDEDNFVAPYLMWITSRVTDADESTNSANIDVEFPLAGIKTIQIDSAIIAAGGNDLRKALADKQVYISGDIDPLRRYLMSFLRRLQDAAMADVSFTHFGWQADGSFLLGDELIGAKRATIPHLQGAAKAYDDKFVKVGDLGTWVEATRIFDLKGMEFQNFAMSLALGAPAHYGAHFPSALVNLYSGDSGSGKTLTGKFGLSAWGNPETLMLAAKDTAASVYKHFGTLSNMGAYIDEMTTMKEDDLRNFVMSIQDGKERGRLVRTADGFRDAAKWRMPIITSSNKDMYELLGKSITSEAEELRILQLSCPRVPYLSEHGTRVGYRLQVLLERNHGLAGPLFVKELLNMGGPEEVYEQMMDEFDKKMKFKFLGQERFYKGMVIVAYLSGKIYTKLGLIKYDYMKGIRAVMKEITALRHNRDSQAHDGFDTVAQFLTEKQSEMVFFTKTPTNSFAREPVPRGAVGRVELEVDVHDTVTSGTIFINRTAFRKWGSRNGVEARSTIAKLREAGATVKENTRATLYKGVVGSLSGQTHCFAIDAMSHSTLIAACDNNKPDATDADGSKRLEEVTT